MTLHPTAGNLQIIVRIAVFRGLKPETVQHIIAPATAVTLKAHSVLFRPGDPATAFFIVIDGWINLYWINVSGEETVIHILNQRRQLCRGSRLYRRAFPGDRGGAHQRQVRTDTRGSYRQVHSRKSGYCTCDDRVNIAAFASSSAASRAAQSTARRAACLAEFLASLAPVEHGSCVIALPYDKVLIAARLGLKPESLSRAFAKLRSVGVAVHAAHVAVSDIAKLRRLATDERSTIRGTFRDAR